MKFYPYERKEGGGGGAKKPTSSRAEWGAQKVLG